MNHRNSNMTLLAMALLVTACGNGTVDQMTGQEGADVATTSPSVTFTPENDGAAMASPSGPIQISYRIIGKPIVGEPLAIDLRITSTLEDQPFNVSYRINDVTAMRLPESQPASVAVVPNIGEDFTTQQVIVIPLREGRLYLNVAAEFDTGDGTMSTVTAIPIQVGSGTRVLQENGVVMTDENGELIRSLPARED
ncbi:MAG: hypothetical protein IIA10_09150 [Proteobacteria bacterium]|nr:hypothetical protein [Pseudomonadota bacterium]